MATYYRRDDDVQNGLGQAMPNIAVTYYLQPGLTLATIYSDATGTPASNPQYTNGLGQTAAYMEAGVYTIVYSGAQIQTLTYPDQVISAGAGGGMTHATVTPAADGVTRIFTLSASASAAPADDQFFVAGSFVPYETSYTVSGTTLTWTGAVPPQTGDSLDYFVA